MTDVILSIIQWISIVAMSYCVYRLGRLHEKRRNLDRFSAFYDESMLGMVGDDLKQFEIRNAWHKSAMRYLRGI